jgi:hypothetical protein
LGSTFGCVGAAHPIRKSREVTTMDCNFILSLL